MNKKIQGLSKIFRPPSTQKSDRNYRSSFSLHASNSSVLKGDFSACNIPRPQRYSFRDSESKGRAAETSRVDTYTALKSEYEGLKEELGKRNATILSLQDEIKSMKEKYAAEK